MDYVCVSRLIYVFVYSGFFPLPITGIVPLEMFIDVTDNSQTGSNIMYILISDAVLF